jgi:hypothetical protein
LTRLISRKHKAHLRFPPADFLNKCLPTFLALMLSICSRVLLKVCFHNELLCSQKYELTKLWLEAWLLSVAVIEGNISGTLLPLRQVTNGKLFP